MGDNYAERREQRANAGPIAPTQRMVLAMVRTVLASCAGRIRTAHDPLGRRSVKRQAEAFRTLHQVRPQGRDATASGLD